MVISHNMLALNANRQFNIINKNKAKSTEKLSSGYRINRAADDAAGLSISEKMRRQIRGLSQGVKNTEDGVSLCQVADGALAEVSEMLHRITELSVQSANGTNTDEDRKAIQQEIKQILKEIDRIGDTTTFNERKIFVGGAQGIDGSNINSGNNVIIGYRPEIITSTVPVQKSDSFVFNISGESTELVGQTYTVSSAITSDSGLIIGTDTVSWSSITDENGSTVDLNNDISAGTYSFDYKGITVSFDVTRDVTAEQFVDGLKGLSWTTKKGNNLQINYSLTATTTADYSNNKKNYKVQATNDGIIVNDVLYSWPDSVKNSALEGNTFDINAGDVQFKLSVGSDNTASLSDIIQNIGTKTINETTRTSYTTPISQMSISRSDADADVKTSNEMIDLMSNTSCIKTDTDGMWIEIGTTQYNKMSWADLDAGAMVSNGLTKRVYSDGNLTFSFSANSDLSNDDIASYLNGTILEVTYGNKVNYDVISKSPGDTYYPGNYPFYVNNTLTSEEAHNDFLLQQFSFTAIGDGTPTYIRNDDSEYSTVPHIMDNPYKVAGSTGFSRSVRGNILAFGIKGSVDNGYELQNATELRDYFNRRDYNKNTMDRTSINLVFKHADGGVVSVKMLDDLTYSMTLDEFVNAITDRASYYNEPLLGLVFPETGKDVTYTYTVGPKKNSITVETNYSQYSGTVASQYKNISAVEADTVRNVPQYIYTENETRQQEVQVPIYGNSSSSEGSSQTERGRLWIQSGSEAGQGMFLEIDRMNTTILGINDLDVSTVGGANHALDAVKDALEKVSSNRSKIGAQQNRLEHTIANELNVVENTTSAESRIRDTDMSKEMVAFSKDMILENVGQAMLAQANQSNQGVLSLLQ